jgi:hypothetical protein
MYGSTSFKVCYKNNQHITHDLIGCGACFITAHSTCKTSQWLPVNMYFIKGIENLSAVLCEVIKYFSEHSKSVAKQSTLDHASQHFSYVLTNPCVLFNFTQHKEAFSIPSKQLEFVKV